MSARIRIRCPVAPAFADGIRALDSSDVEVSVVLPNGEEAPLAGVIGVEFKIVPGEIVKIGLLLFNAEFDIEGIAASLPGKPVNSAKE